MLDYYANVAEIIGVVLVVVTLVFLTMQIRQNTRAIRSTTIQAVMQSEMALSKILADNSAIWEKVLTAAPLQDGEEKRRAIVVYNVFMIDTETRYHQFKAGYLYEASWEGRLNILPEVIELPIFGPWRRSFGGARHSTDFLELIDGMAKEKQRHE